MMMRYFIVCIVGALLSLASCKNELESDGEAGNLKLSLGVSDKVEVVSRSLTQDENAVLAQNCKIRIFSGNTLVKRFQGVESLPNQIPLVSGDYSVRVTAGDSVAASFTQRFFEGEKQFTISKGQTNEVEVNCGIANTVIQIVWDESLKTVFKEDCSVKVTSATGELVFSQADTQAKGYFSLPADQMKLTCTFSGTPIAKADYSSVSELTDLKPSTLYKLTYSYTASEQTPTGGAALKVKIDETPLAEEEHVITIKQRPVISCIDNSGISYDLTQSMFLEQGSKTEYYIQVATSSPLTQLSIQNDNFTEWGVMADQIDLLNIEETQNDLASQGISIEEKKNTLQGDFYKIKFATSLMEKMTASEGNFSTIVKAVDTEGKSRDINWNIVVSNATVTTSEILPYEVWTSRATLRGVVTADRASQPRFQYREKNSTEWTVVDAELQGKTFSKEITGLKPATTYEYQAMDGEQVSSVLQNFTTEAAFQPENAGFEYTSGTSPILMYGDGQSMWWDTGNHGSAKMSKNVTTPDTSVKHSGNQSVLLSSQFVGFLGIGKFAAGNLFVGKYLKTDGTDGVLGWGRPCTSRPKALKVWVKYAPGTVDYGGNHLTNGMTDQGIIYVALGDWTGQEAEGETWPFIVKTKNASSLFSTEKGTYSGDGTIAYAEKVFTEAYNDSENMKELTIELNYNDYGGMQRKPTSIIIVASASKYGDYFEGSGSSKMWLDDMELIYE